MPVPKELGNGIRALYECDSLGIATLTPAGLFLATNKGLQRMLGYDERELAALTFNEVTHLDEIPLCDREFGRLLRREIDNFEIEKRFIRKDGAILWAHIVVAAVREEGKLLRTIGVARDITRRKAAEESVRRLTADLQDRAALLARAEAELREQSEALARSNVDLDTFASAAAHDLNAPLRRIIGFGELLRGNLKDRLDPGSADMLARMQNCAAGMSKLISDVLALSRVGRETLALEVVDLNLLTAGVLSDLSGAINEAAATVEADCLPAVRAHSSLLRRVLQNLISNAIKFRRRDEPLRVRVESRRDEEGFVEISVADNGIGFEQKDAEKIFEPFIRLHPAGEYPGNGIGLAICRRIAQRYGGRMSAVSGPGKGTVFKLALPAAMLAA